MRILLLLLASMFCASAQINTNGWADSPFISADGMRLYFTYSRFDFGPYFFNGGAPPILAGPERLGHHDNVDPNQDFDNYVAVRNPDGTWQTPVNLGILNTYSSDWEPNEFWNPSIGAMQLLHTDHSVTIWESTWTTSGWSAAVKPTPYPATMLTDDNPAITVLANGIQFMVFDSQRPGGFGGSDLWITYLLPGASAWSTPSNMGPLINTVANETQPWLSLDGTLLYFTRSCGLYYSRYTNGVWTSPIAVNVGQFACAAEPSLTADKKELFFAAVSSGPAPLYGGIKIMHILGSGDGVTWNLPALPVD